MNGRHRTPIFRASLPSRRPCAGSLRPPTFKHPMSSTSNGVGASPRADLPGRSRFPGYRLARGWPRSAVRTSTCSRELAAGFARLDTSEVYAEADERGPRGCATIPPAGRSAGVLDPAPRSVKSGQVGRGQRRATHRYLRPATVPTTAALRCGVLTSFDAEGSGP